MKKFLVIILCLLVSAGIGIGVGFSVYKFNHHEEPNKYDNKIKNVKEKRYDGETYYIYDGKYDGEYSLEYYDFPKPAGSRSQFVANFNKTDVLDYDEYVDFIEKYDLKKEYSDSSKNYVVISYAVIGGQGIEVKLANVEAKSKKATVYLYEEKKYSDGDISAYVLVIPTEKNPKEVEVISLITNEEFKNIKKYGHKEDPRYITEDKPMIYIYPEKEMDVNVKLGYPDKLTTTYPKYNNGWNVTALPDGTLKYNGREYYGLYWEGNKHTAKVENEGFVVKGEEVEKFLEEKLNILGLTEREANEFIVYWLPKLEHNKYNYIRFETKEEIEDYMPLEVSPKPDTIIRVIMDYKVLDDRINVKEQVLVPQTRTGYTVVEWGGAEIK